MSRRVRALSVVLPVFEEAGTLPDLVRRLTRVLDAHAITQREILVVVSERAEDGTPALAAELPGVTVVPEEPGGYGGAVAAGVAAAQYDWLLLLDGDGQFLPEELGRFLTAAETADAVLGVRRPRADSRARRLAGRLYGFVARHLLRLPRIADLDCAFKLVRRALLAGPPLQARTGAVNAEMLQRIAAAGGHVVERPVRHLSRRRGRARFECFGLPRPSAALALLRDLLRLA